MQPRSLSYVLLSCLAAAAVLSMGCSAGNAGSGGRPRPPPSEFGNAGRPGASDPNDFGHNPTMQPVGSGLPIESGGPCVNLQCRTADYCPGGVKTTVSGKVFDPAGLNPLYNIAVYVPNEPLAALPKGATCNACDDLYTGSPVAASLTNSSGSFVMSSSRAVAAIFLTRCRRTSGERRTRSRIHSWLNGSR